MWSVQNGHFDDVDVDKVKEFQNGLIDFMNTRKDALMKEIAEKKALDDDIVAKLKSAVEEYKTANS